MSTDRKVYTKVVFDMTSDDVKVIEEECYLYDGPFALCQEGDDDTEGDDTQGDAPEQPSQKEVLDTLAEIKKAVSGNQEAISEVNQFVKEFKQRRAEGAPEDDSKGKKGEGDDDYQIPSDLEMLSRKDYMDVILNTMMKRLERVVDDKVKPLGEKVDQTEESVVRDKIKEEFDAARRAHKDFDEWKPELEAKFKRNMYLTPEEAYTLVRAENPEKAKQLDAKYTTKESDEDTSGFYGGMAPLHKKVEKLRKKNKNMSEDEAGELAWETIFGSNNDVF